MALYGFVTDRALIDPSQRLINLETLNISCGFLDREMIEHFVAPLEIVDQRSVRLPIEYRREPTDLSETEIAILNNIFTTIIPLGEEHISTNPEESVTLVEYPIFETAVFDSDILPTGPVSLSTNFDLRITLDNNKFTPIEASALSSMSQDEIGKLMNIVEYVTYGIIRTDSLADINDHLVSDNTKFGGYLTTSIKLFNGNTIIRLYGEANVHRLIPKSFGFNFISGGENLTFVFWIDRNNFKLTYPLYTVSLIVPPLPLDTLLDPSLLTDPLSAIHTSKTLSNTLVGPEIINNDQSGMVTFTTRYIWNGTTHMLSFEIMYRGRCPDVLELRQILEDYLLGSGVGSRAIWEIRFPDIFIENQFYIVPFYDEQTILTNSDIYRSIIDINIVTTKFRNILNGMRVVENMFELMTVAYDRMFIGIASDTINIIRSMIELHPGYRDFSSTDIGFAEMTPDDREWSILFNQALAVAIGELNDSTIGRVNIGGREFICLIRNKTAYNILTKESYLAYINV